MRPRLFLCFAHLENGRFHDARRHGLVALSVAEALASPDWIKKALYLLGEVANMGGEIEAADSYFTRLQREFFPGETYLPGFLLAVDIRNFVNLHA
jgi:hypothetical protein